MTDTSRELSNPDNWQLDHYSSYSKLCDNFRELQDGRYKDCDYYRSRSYIKDRYDAYFTPHRFQKDEHYNGTGGGVVDGDFHGCIDTTGLVVIKGTLFGRISNTGGVIANRIAPSGSCSVPQKSDHFK